MATKGMSVSGWTTVVIGVVVLFAVLAGLYPTLIQQANAFKNATSGNALAAVLVTLLPIIISAAILLLIVFEFMPTGGHGSRYSRRHRR
jgi:cytochrome bd-type quinol oxidase subunit 2